MEMQSSVEEAQDVMEGRRRTNRRTGERRILGLLVEEDRRMGMDRRSGEDRRVVGRLLYSEFSSVYQ